VTMGAPHRVQKVPRLGAPHCGHFGWLMGIRDMIGHFCDKEVSSLVGQNH